MPADPNHVIVTGENPFIRLSQTDGGDITTNASFGASSSARRDPAMCSISRAS